MVLTKRSWFTRLFTTIEARLMVVVGGTASTDSMGARGGGVFSLEYI
jgi:hypothetical protein